MMARLHANDIEASLAKSEVEMLAHRARLKADPALPLRHIAQAVHDIFYLAHNKTFEDVLAIGINHADGHLLSLYPN